MRLKFEAGEIKYFYATNERGSLLQIKGWGDPENELELNTVSCEEDQEMIAMFFEIHPEAVSSTQPLFELWHTEDWPQYLETDARMYGNKIKYSARYKYLLQEDFRVKLSFSPKEEINTVFISFRQNGDLYLAKGYTWDGLPGPTIDIKHGMRASLIHDALYQVIRESHLDDSYRERADEELHRLLIEDGMSRTEAWWVYLSAKIGKGPQSVADRKEILVAP